MEQTPLVLLLDGNNLTLRSHFAMRQKNSNGEYEILKTSDGRECGALFGMIKVFFTYYRRFKPTHVLVFFDDGRSVYRTKIRETYKSNRIVKSREEQESRRGLQDQFKLIRDFFKIIGVRSYSEYGVEADDLFATATDRWLVGFKDPQIIIISADHDLRQLISDKVRVLKPAIGIVKEELYTKERIKEIYGLPPERLPELWSLTGDNADSIAGVRGVGPKTAFKMLKDHSLDEALAREPKLKDELVNVYENMSLITLHPNLARKFCLSLEHCRVEVFKEEVLREFFLEWEFKTLVDQLDKGTLFT